MFEQLSDTWWVLILIGLGAGIIGGALGVGGGIIFVPALVILLLIPQKSAQGISLAVMVPMAFLGAIRYWRNPEVIIDMNIVIMLAIGALVGVLVGTELAKHLPVYWLRKMFAVFIVIVAARMFFTPVKQQNSSTIVANQSQPAEIQMKGESNE